ncbi:hypothetical protein [Sinosporangium siamense]|uniref:Uncharacterized protein n=1 Tax=Sinosporangium siamense TaxID=1367973 RepID=A0A919V8E7_9ACTN|nr:hypothetical protein [Sinosporangium siamense]GII93152.1 hypothetical protein Ssi02_33830 [Sinosporangium siamense]
MNTGSGFHPRPALSLGLAVAVSLAVVTAGVVVIVTRVVEEQRRGGQAAATVRPSATSWEAGACVRREPGTFVLASCAGAAGTVTRVVEGSPAQCPPNTDEFAAVRGSRTACLRNLSPPHPGDPGGGGGVLRSGDCVDAGGGERPCTSGTWYGKALAVTISPEKCPSATVETIAVGRDALVCLGPGGRVLGRGHCLAKPNVRLVARSALRKVACTSSDAWARVVDFAVSHEKCRQESDHYLRVSDHRTLRPVTCLRRLSAR